jgi:hypothetical protein
MIKRDRGDPPSVLMKKESTGEKYYINHQGKIEIEKPIVKQIPNGKNVEISIQARDIKEARSILTSLKKKYPAMDIDSIMANANHVEEYIDEPLHIKMTVGGKESLPAILKMAINFYIEHTSDTLSVKDAIEDLRNNDYKLVEPVILTNKIFDLADDEITHSIFINADSTTHRLYAIIDLFSTFQFFVKLSINYTGESFSSLYVFDVLTRKELVKTSKNIPSFDYVFDFKYQLSNPQFNIMREEMNHCMHIAMQRQHSLYREMIINEAWTETIDKMIPEGQPITREAYDAFSNYLMIKLGPYMQRYVPK